MVFTFTEASATNLGAISGDYPYYNIEFPGQSFPGLTNGTLQAFDATDVLIGQGTVPDQSCSMPPA